MCIGDFNEIVKVEKKMGGALRRERQMREFQEALDFCGFRDLGPVWYVCLKTENCCLKIFVEIRVGEKVS